MRHFLLFVPFYRNSLYVVIVIDTASEGDACTPWYSCIRQNASHMKEISVRRRDDLS
jgi:hypothetical protein